MLKVNLFSKKTYRTARDTNPSFINTYTVIKFLFFKEKENSIRLIF